MREIASFQNGVNIIGQPEYVVIYEDYIREDKGIKIGSYTQKNFKEKVRIVFHRFFIFSLLLLGFTSCSPEALVDEVEIPTTQEFIKKEFHGHWEHSTKYDTYNINAYNMVVSKNAGSNIDVHSPENSSVSYSQNGFVLTTRGGQKITVTKQSSSTIMINGEIYFK